MSDWMRWMIAFGLLVSAGLDLFYELRRIQPLSGIIAVDPPIVFATPELQPRATATVLPEPEPLLFVGIKAQVQALDDTYLNFRAEPHLGSEVLAFLKNGTLVDIIGGPVEADGYKWWNVLIVGRVGWVVEIVEDVPSLIPYQPKDDK